MDWLLVVKVQSCSTINLPSLSSENLNFFFSLLKAFCHRPLSRRQLSVGNFGVSPCCHHTQGQAGNPEGEDLNKAGKLVPGEAHTSFVWSQKEQMQPLQLAPGQSSVTADKPCLPGSSGECNTEMPTICAQSSCMRLAVETQNLPLMGLFFFQQCFVCGERGAAITCAENGCERSFHLPCAVDGECVTQFFGQHSSYCWEHRPRQAVQEAPAEGTNCLICLEPVGDSLSYHILVCPACKHAWFHRRCIQQQAFSVGTLSFQCASCREEDLFHLEMSTMGIQIPARLVFSDFADIKSVILGLPGECLGRPGPWLLHEHVPQLHSESGSRVGVDRFG
ncbi:uncharacterized protein LOC116239612 isoform X1 [Phasianus colchicus]|uniref:uncharacterized protein LOC116239612 isoform X1 n=1 Tax=Phasianus colchicus TaxID=9054 RepID=UPI00129E49F7|nr:uncharacterized protein LOC116239612 isoform X1 [Phasianus colchicus]